MKMANKNQKKKINKRMKAIYKNYKNRKKSKL